MSKVRSTHYVFIQQKTFYSSNQSYYLLNADIFLNIQFIINESLARLTKIRERTQITNIRNERGDSTTDPMENKSIIKEYYESLHDQKFDILGERKNFLK